MLRSLIDAYRILIDVDTFTALVTLGLVASAHVLIKMSTGSTLLAVIFTPFLALGGLTARLLFQNHFVNYMNDKDANTVLSVACGVLFAMLAMTIITKIAGSLNDWRWRRKKPGRQPPAAVTAAE